jgi:hypothetical protein
LKGFDNATRDKISAATGQMRRVDFNLVSLSARCDCESPGTTLREMTDRVDAVVHLRITTNNIDNETPAFRWPFAYFTQTAEVIEIVKYPETAGPPFDSATRALQDLLKRNPSAGSVRTVMTFLQDQSSGAPLPYEPGDEFVLFLKWWPAGRVLVAQTMHAPDRSDRDTMFAILNGRVTRAPRSLTRYVNASVEALLADLRHNRK